MGDVLAVAQVFELIAQVLAHERDATSVRLRYESALKEYKAQSIVNPTFRYWMSGRKGNIADNVWWQLDNGVGSSMVMSYTVQIPILTGKIQ
jgi:hypothetical protein